MLTLDLPNLPTQNFDTVPAESALPPTLPPATAPTAPSSTKAAKSSTLSVESPAGAIPTTQVYRPQPGSTPDPIALETDLPAATPD